MTTSYESDEDAQVFDRSALLDSLRGDHELLQQFIDLFLRDFPGKIETLREAAPNEDGTGTANTEVLRIAAHKVLGSARTMRLHRLAAAALALEQLAEAPSYRPKDLAAGAERVHREYQRVAAILQR
ncbi:MAG: Hpt domain-containing protein [Alkalispirochaeta sp.]